jgi:hypothetical protein
MIPEKIKDLIKWKPYPENKYTGGQTCGTFTPGITLICEEVGLEISINNYRSQIKNRDLCLLLFELYLQEIKTI